MTLPQYRLSASSNMMEAYLCFLVTRQLEMRTTRCAPHCLAAAATFTMPCARLSAAA